MKTTTFYINKTKKNNSNNNFRLADYSKMLDAIITRNVKAKNPYLFGEEIGWDGFTYGTEHKPITIDINLGKKKSCSGCPLKGLCGGYTLNTFTDAINFLANYKKFAKDDYDFKLSDGTPVKFFSDGSIQIGYDLYYPNEDYSNIYDILDTPKKKSIIDIYIKLK